MTAPTAVAADKSRSHQIVAGRIHYQAFTRWLTGFSPRESNRVRITNRSGRLLLLGTKS